MPTTILDGETYEQAYARRFAEEAIVDAEIMAKVEAAKAAVAANPSPLAQLFSAVIALDTAELSIREAALIAKAAAYSRACEILDTNPEGWDVDSLGHNLESNFPELSPEECDNIAERAISRGRI